jgi:hypothetical protein
LAENQPAEQANMGVGLKSIRKRRWFVWGIIIIYLPAMWTVLSLSGSFGATATAFFVWLILLCVIVTIAAVARCPRCGNYFHMHGMTLLFARRCIHCQLHVNADKKPDN